MTTRRSSFFCRQLSAIDNSVCQDDDGSTESSQEEEENILNHVANVEQAISDWRTKYWQAKSKYKELEKFKDNVNIIQHNELKDILLPEDIQFLNQRLDYTVLFSKLQTLIDKVEIAKSQVSKMYSNANTKICLLENIAAEIKRKICVRLLQSDESADLFTF